jgi:hypothetical protein
MINQSTFGIIIMLALLIGHQQQMAESKITAHMADQKKGIPKIALGHR